MNHATTNTGKICLKSRVRYRSIGEDGVLVHLDSGRVIVVSDVGLRIIEALDKPMTHDELSRLISTEFEVDRAQAAIDLEAFCLELDNEEVLEHEILEHGG
jgi:hypothetical protein